MQNRPSVFSCLTAVVITQGAGLTSTAFGPWCSLRQVKLEFGTPILSDSRSDDFQTGGGILLFAPNCVRLLERCLLV